MALTCSSLHAGLRRGNGEGLPCVSQCVHNMASACSRRLHIICSTVAAHTFSSLPCRQNYIFPGNSLHTSCALVPHSRQTIQIDC
jgi:hypothetical protein